MFAKYLSADGCFVKTNTINCGDNDDAICFLILRRLPLLGSPWNQISLEVLERSICIAACLSMSTMSKFWFAKKLKMNLRIATTDTSFYKYQHHAKILIVFSRWCNCLILHEIIFYLEILRDYSV